MGSEAPQKGSNYDEISMHHSLHFAESLNELKNLRKQLYSAAEYFESSYDKDDHQQRENHVGSVMGSSNSKDYVAKAVVSTVDHLGSVADKLNKFLEEKANEFSATNIKFSRIQQRLSTFQGFMDMRGISTHSLIMDSPNLHKHYIIPESLQIGKSKLIYSNLIRSQFDMQQSKQDNPFAKGFQAPQIKPQPPMLRKGQSMVASPSPIDFSFLRIMPKKETGKRLVSPRGFGLKRSGSVANRSVSPSPRGNKQRCTSEARRAMLMNTNREGVIGESYTKRSKHLFKALLNAHRSRK